MTPAQLVAQVRMRRGDDPGPPERPARNDNLYDPEDDAAYMAQLLGDDAGAGPQADPGPTRPNDQPTGRRVRRDPAPQDPTPEEGVSLTSRVGYYMGHMLNLTEAESKTLKDLLARVVLRQLREEKKRISGGG